VAVPDDLRDDVVHVPVANESETSRHRMPPGAVGFLYLQAGRPDLAEPRLAEAIPRRGEEPDIAVPGIAQKLILLGVTREMIGQLEQAASAHEWAVRASVATAGDRDRETIRARANLARTYAALKRPQDAEPLLNDVIPVFEAESNDSELAVALNALGLARQCQQRHAEALACFDRALALFEKLKGPDYIECATVLRNLANSAEEQGDLVGARRARNRADKIARQKVAFT
jgi:tetratricopeptide (TPR) repeat protein